MTYDSWLVAFDSLTLGKPRTDMSLQHSLRSVCRFVACKVCLSHESWVMSHVSATRVSVYGMSHVNTSRVMSRVNESCHVWMSHVTCEWVMSRVNESCHVWLYVRHDSFICATWLIHTCNMTHSYVRHDSFIRATWLIYMCDMTHLYVTWFTQEARRHMNESCHHVTSHDDMIHSYVCRDSCNLIYHIYGALWMIQVTHIDSNSVTYTKKKKSKKKIYHTH